MQVKYNVRACSKRKKTVTLLKSIAMVAGLAIILWSLGLPTLRFADAANITSVSDTLSDSAPSASADHTIEFVTPSGVANGEVRSTSYINVCMVYTSTVSESF